MKKKQNITNITTDQIVLPDSMIYFESNRFQSQMKQLSVEDKKRLLEVMRFEREFYKKTMSEDYRAKNPGSYRYADAEKRLERLSLNGKYLAEIIKTS